MAGCILRHGKYRYRSFDDIEIHDREYCAWVLRSNVHTLPPSLASFSNYLRDHHRGILTVGRNKFKYFDEVLREDPNYCNWVLTLTDTSGNLSDFKQFLCTIHMSDYDFQEDEPPEPWESGDDTNSESDSRSRSPSIRTRTQARSIIKYDPSDKDHVNLAKECHICYNAPIRACFSRCGHMLCCVPCAIKCDKCPVCRVNIRECDVIRVFGC